MAKLPNMTELFGILVVTVILVYAATFILDRFGITETIAVGPIFILIIIGIAALAAFSLVVDDGLKISRKNIFGALVITGVVYFALFRFEELAPDLFAAGLNQIRGP